MNQTGEEFYVHVTCRRDITYAFDVRNRLEMVCESLAGIFSLRVLEIMNRPEISLGRLEWWMRKGNGRSNA